MTRRHIHYEAAFEDYLRSEGIAYLAVDEHKKAIFSGARVKSFDFLLYRNPGETWLVDIKGRKFPYDTPSNKRYWENWITQDDLDGLKKWTEVFGEGFTAVIVFAYLLLGPEDRQPTPYAHPFRGNFYAFLAIPAATYARHARGGSARGSWPSSGCSPGSGWRVSGWPRPAASWKPETWARYGLRHEKF